MLEGPSNEISYTRFFLESSSHRALFDIELFRIRVKFLDKFTIFDRLSIPLSAKRQDSHIIYRGVETPLFILVQNNNCAYSLV